MKTKPLPPPKVDAPTLSNSKRKSGRTLSFVVSLVVHALIIGGATYFVTTVQQPRHEEFLSGPPITTKPVARLVKHDPVDERREEGAAAMMQRVMVDNPSVVSMPDMPSSSSPDGLRGATGSGLGGFGSGSELPSAAISPVRGDFTPMFGIKEGSGKTAGLLTGHFYDLKQMRDRKINAELERRGVAVGTGLGPNELAIAKLEFAKLAKLGWSNSYLAKFFQAPQPLYASRIFIPVMSANQAPREFGVADLVQPRAWLARYKGKISPPSDGVYRFVGLADDFMYVRFEGRLVLDASIHDVGSGFVTDRPKKSQYRYGESLWEKLTVGRRIEMKAGNYYNIDILIGEGPGGVFCSYLLYEKEGEKYEMNALGNPILPVFRLDDSPIPVSQQIPTRRDSPIWRSQDVSKAD